MNKKYILEILGLQANYPFKHVLRKGGIYGVYSAEEKAEEALKRFLKEHENYTKDDCKISEIEWD